jgi:diadenosine tetraphosphate (Ap4A) HIT family hydrolase/GNAT superfamily N-acetyltransferase
MQACPFCEPQVNDEPVVDQDERCFVIDLQHEVLDGSRIIVPREHRTSPFELTDAEVASTFELLRRVKVDLDGSMFPDGYNIGWNCGPVAGQEVEHVHLHVIPRFADEPYAGRGIRYWLKQDSNRRTSLRKDVDGAEGSLPAVEFRRRPPLTNQMLGDLLEPDTAVEGRENYEKLLVHSLTWIGAFDGDRLIGYANVAWDGGVHAFLLDPTVHPKLRGRGIGTHLVKEAIAAVAEYSKIEWLHVDSSAEFMERFYLPAGFRPTPAGLVWMQDVREEGLV